MSDMKFYRHPDGELRIGWAFFGITLGTEDELRLRRWLADNPAPASEGKQICGIRGCIIFKGHSGEHKFADGKGVASVPLPPLMSEDVGTWEPVVPVVQVSDECTTTSPAFRGTCALGTAGCVTVHHARPDVEAVEECDCPRVPDGCRVYAFSSRVCERGTKSCVVEHPTPAAPVRCFSDGKALWVLTSPENGVFFYLLSRELVHSSACGAIIQSHYPEITPTEALALLSDWPEGKAKLEGVLGVRT